MDFLSPHADFHPPRHEIESDDEDDDDYDSSSLAQANQQPPFNITLTLPSESKRGQPLIILSGAGAGKHWLRGTDAQQQHQLGEQRGSVHVGDIQIGSIFSPPSWTSSSGSGSESGKATILVSEMTSMLPVSAMYTYAETVLDQLKPSSVTILDTYSPATYISNVYIPSDSAPVRYIIAAAASTNSSSSTSAKSILSKSPFEPFSPPNMIQSTSAAFLSILSLSLSPSSCTEAHLLLLPSRTSNHFSNISESISSRRSNDLDGYGYEEEEEGWGVKRVVLMLAGVKCQDEGEGEVVGSRKRGDARGKEGRKRPARGWDDGGGMYI